MPNFLAVVTVKPKLQLCSCLSCQCESLNSKAYMPLVMGRLTGPTAKDMEIIFPITQADWQAFRWPAHTAELICPFKVTIFSFRTDVTPHLGKNQAMRSLLTLSLAFFAFASPDTSTIPSSR